MISKEKSDEKTGLLRLLNPEKANPVPVSGNPILLSKCLNLSDIPKVKLLLLLSFLLGDAALAQDRCAKRFASLPATAEIQDSKIAFSYEPSFPLQQIHGIPADVLGHMDSETSESLSLAHLLLQRILAKPHSLEETQKIHLETFLSAQKLQEHRRISIQQKREKRFLVARLRNIQKTSPKSFDARIRELEKAIEMDQRVSDSLGQILKPLRQYLGDMTISLAAFETAKKNETVVVLRSLQPEAVGQMMHKGFGKGIRYKFHSADDEVLAGMVPRDQKFSKKGKTARAEEIAKLQREVEDAIAKGTVIPVPYKIGSLVAVEEDGKIKSVDSFRQPVHRMKIVQVLAEPADGEDAKLLVSDVDPFGFAKKSTRPPTPVIETKNYGILTEEEKEMVKDFNREVSKLLQREPSKIRYMPHGPENRNPHSKGIQGYPLQAFFPDGRRKTILEGPKNDPHRDFRLFLEELENAGYHLDPNPLWQ